MTVADFIVAYLHDQGVRRVFEVSGGMITYLLDSLNRHAGIEVTSMHHEQGASFAAEGLARMNGIPGIALATSGPGAINLLTGVGSCYFDSTPAIFITGQVNRHEQKGQRAIRQLGFQETDIVAMAEPIAKAAWRVTGVEQLPELLAKSFEVALEGRPGPVLLDIPMDIQRSSIAIDHPPKPKALNRTCDSAEVAEMLNALGRAARPLILVGGGIRSSRTTDRLREFAAAVKTPVVHSLMAVDVLAASDPYRAGMIGTYGNRWSNLAMGESDFLLVLGSRLDIRQTGSDVRAFQAGRTIYHVDVEAGEVNNRVTGCRAILTNLPEFFEEAIPQAARRAFPDRGAWLSQIADLRQQYPDTAEPNVNEGLNPNEVMHRLSESSTEATAFIADVGQHQMWAAQSLNLHSNQRFLTSGGMGAMGSGLPLAIGASLAGANKDTGASGDPVVLVAGDGGFQLNIQELQTVVRNRLPVKIVILNNSCHGMVRQFQENYFEKRYQSTLWGYSAPDFAAVSTAYGIASGTASDSGGLNDALRAMWSDLHQPFLLQVMVNPFVNAYPKIAFGRPMTEMEPLASPLEVEST